MASPWNVRILPGAHRQLRNLDEDVKLEAFRAITELREDPLPFDSTPMGGYGDCYRVPFSGGRYRIVYRVKPRSKMVIVGAVGRRDTVYLGMLKPGPKKPG